MVVRGYQKRKAGYEEKLRTKWGKLTKKRRKSQIGVREWEWNKGEAPFESEIVLETVNAFLCNRLRGVLPSQGLAQSRRHGDKSRRAYGRSGFLHLLVLKPCFSSAPHDRASGRDSRPACHRIRDLGERQIQR